MALDTAPWIVYLTLHLINYLRKYQMPTDQLTATFAALADPTRRAILARLAEGDATVTQLAEPFPLTLPAISRHLKVLESARLISRDRSAQFRPSRLRTQPLEEATAWMDTYREMWESRIGRLDEHLRAIQKGNSRE